MVEMTKISTHGRTRNTAIRKTTRGHGMYTIVWGSGSNRQSRTMHCSEAEAQKFKDSLKDN